MNISIWNQWTITEICIGWSITKCIFLCW